MKATLEVVAEASSGFAKSEIGVVRNSVKVAPFKTLVAPVLNSTNVEAARNEPHAADR
jgi:hypothetical protein